MGIFFVGSNSIDELGENDLGGLAGWFFLKEKSAVQFYHFPWPVRPRDVYGLSLGEKERPECTLLDTVGGEFLAGVQLESRSRKPWHIDVELVKLSTTSISGGVLSILLMRVACLQYREETASTSVIQQRGLSVTAAWRRPRETRIPARISTSDKIHASSFFAKQSYPISLPSRESHQFRCF